MTTAPPAPLPIHTLRRQLRDELDRDGTICGVAAAEIYQPPADGVLRRERGAVTLASPLGTACAGRPLGATELVWAWSLGARLFELPAAAARPSAARRALCHGERDSVDGRQASQPADLASLTDEVTKVRWLCGELAERLGHPVDDRGLAFSLRLGAADWPTQRRAITDWAQRAAESDLTGSRLERDDQDLSGFESAAAPCPIDRSLTLTIDRGQGRDELSHTGVELVAAVGQPVTLELDPSLLGSDELARVIRGAGGPLHADVLRRAVEARLSFEDAIWVIRSVAEAAERRGVGFGLRLTGALPLAAQDQGAAGMPRAELGRAVVPALARLSHLLTDRLRARVPMSVTLRGQDADLMTLAAAGLLPVVTCMLAADAPDLPLVRAQLEPLAEAVRRSGAGHLDAWACCRALADGAQGRRFRRRVREHAEANAGTCLHDRQWEAAWQAFAASSVEPSVARRVEQALRSAGAAPDEAMAIAQQVLSASHRVQRARWAESLRPQRSPKGSERS